MPCHDEDWLNDLSSMPPVSVTMQPVGTCLPSMRAGELLELDEPDDELLLVDPHAAVEQRRDGQDARGDPEWIASLPYLLFRGRPWPPAPGAVLDVRIIGPVLHPDRQGGEQVPGHPADSG